MPATNAFIRILLKCAVEACVLTVQSRCCASVSESVKGVGFKTPCASFAGSNPAASMKLFFRLEALRCCDSAATGLRMSTRNVTRVCVQGNIGAGKSTVLSLLEASDEQVTTCPEQVEAWKPWLALFYAGMEGKGRNTRSFGFHLQILLSFARERRKARATPTVVFERSPCCSRSIFVAMAHEHGDVDDPELELYNAMYERTRPAMRPVDAKQLVLV